MAAEEPPRHPVPPFLDEEVISSQFDLQNNLPVKLHSSRHSR